MTRQEQVVLFRARNGHYMAKCFFTRYSTLRTSYLLHKRNINEDHILQTYNGARVNHYQLKYLSNSSAFKNWLIQCRPRYIQRKFYYVFYILGFVFITISRTFARKNLLTEYFSSSSHSLCFTHFVGRPLFF